MARWVSLPQLRRCRRVARSDRALAMRRVWTTDVGHRRHRVSGYADAADDLVSRDVVCEQFQDRHQRLGSATNLGLGQLSDRLGVALDGCGCAVFPTRPPPVSEPSFKTRSNPPASYSRTAGMGTIG